MHVVNEYAFTKNFCRQVDAGAAFADGLEVSDLFARPATSRLDGKVYRPRERPIVLSGCFAIAMDAAVTDGQFIRLASEDLRGLIKK